MSEKVQQSVVASVLTQLTAELRKENEELARARPPSDNHRGKKKTRSLRPRPEPRPYFYSIDDGDCVEVESRLGRSLLQGKAAKVFRHWSPSIFNLPHAIPVEEEISIGGRRWIVKASTLGTDMGYGVFACEDIPVPANLGQDMQYAPTLFPYAGPVYIARHWRVLVRQNPTWRVYQLDMDKWPGIHKRHEHSRTIDGDPVRYPNIAGYINSTQGLKPHMSPNVEWVTVAGTPPPPIQWETGG
jgi:hypothetical protein